MRFHGEDHAAGGRDLEVHGERSGEVEEVAEGEQTRFPILGLAIVDLREGGLDLARARDADDPARSHDGQPERTDARRDASVAKLDRRSCRTVRET